MVIAKCLAHCRTPYVTQKINQNKLETWIDWEPEKSCSAEFNRFLTWKSFKNDYAQLVAFITCNTKVK